MPLRGLGDMEIKRGGAGAVCWARIKHVPQIVGSPPILIKDSGSQGVVTTPGGRNRNGGSQEKGGNRMLSQMRKHLAENKKVSNRGVLGLVRGSVVPKKKKGAKFSVSKGKSQVKSPPWD